MWRVFLVTAMLVAVCGCDEDTAQPVGTPAATSIVTLTPTAVPSPTATTLRCTFDRFHGCEAIHLQATGHFRTEQINGTWWLITPSGNAFFSAGVNHVDPAGDFAPALGTSPYHDNIIARYGSEAAWADVTAARLETLGFTTLGAFSNTALFAARIPYTILLGFAQQAPAINSLPVGLTGLRVRDYFAPAFVSGAASVADGARACASDPYCIGVFSDNELGWGPGLVQARAELDSYLKLPAGAPGKLALQALLESRYGGDVGVFNQVWSQQLTSFDDLQQVSTLPPDADSAPERAADREAFLQAVAARYYQVVHDALRAVSPDLLILGSRLLAYSVPPAVVAGGAPYVDVVSANYYEIAPGILAIAEQQARTAGYIFTGSVFGDLDAIYAIAQKPVLVSEFGYRAADSGLPNTYPPLFPVLATQADRADAYALYLQNVLLRPYIVGAHWFEYADEPSTGRFDGENDNWGIVDIHDDEYVALATRMQQVNGGLDQRPLSVPQPTPSP
jgi:hypothetical protein